MVQVYFEKELVSLFCLILSLSSPLSLSPPHFLPRFAPSLTLSAQAPHIDKTDFLNAVVREKKRFENSLDDSVAAGLNAGTEVLMNQVSWLDWLLCPVSSSFFILHCFLSCVHLLPYYLPLLLFLSSVLLLPFLFFWWPPCSYLSSLLFYFLFSFLIPFSSFVLVLLSSCSSPCSFFPPLLRFVLPS